MDTETSGVITRTAVFCLGLSQLVAWGISYYLIGALGEIITADLGWAPEVVYGGFSAALVTMGVVSARVGAAVDRYGGRRIMAAGGVVGAVACAGLAASTTVMTYYAAWIVLGVAMRMTLYEAAFAALARIAGAGARTAISQITLLGGLALTVFWPVGHFLADAYGWRAAVTIYGVISLLNIPLYLVLPEGRHQVPKTAQTEAPPVREGEGLAAVLYSLSVTLVTFLSAAMSSHMVAILIGLGVAAPAAVWISTVRGVGQSIARLGEVASGTRTHPLRLNVFASALLPVSFVAGLFGGQSITAALSFAFVYGAGNGLSTITRGSMPLVLFDPAAYGARVGKLVAPGFFLAAAAPVIYAAVIARLGEVAALVLSAVLALVILAAGLVLRLRFDKD